MTSGGLGSLPPDVVRFLRTSIDSVEQLDVLLLLREVRERSPHGLSTVAIAGELDTSPVSVAACLRDLVTRGLAVVEDGLFVYAPHPEVEGVVAALASVYAKRRYAVLDFLVGKSRREILLFAEAFRVRGTREDDDG